MLRRTCSSLLLAAMALACGGTTATSPNADGADAGSDATRSVNTAVPKTHRASPVSCPTTRANNPAPPVVPGSECSADSDCTAGKNGRCYGAPIGGSGKGNTCSYDLCANDVDCGGPRVCDCRNTANRDANVCFNGNCRVDADCGAVGYCSPSLVDLGSNCVDVPAGSVGYFCHGAADECTNDDDCASTAGLATCAFDVGALHWKCYAARCTG